MNVMLTIRIPRRSQIPELCRDRSLPRVEDGSLYVYDVTDEEYMFWQGLETSERDNLVDSTSKLCFIDVLHDLMRYKRPNNYLDDSEF